MKKVFVSHSSQDKEIVNLFIDKILRLGLTFSPDDIAYTSREDTGVRTGDDIKTFIKDNISHCDFVFFMISNNYAESQICLNEMGATWAMGKKVIPLVFPNIGFDSIGWLYITNKGVRLIDSSGLDSVFDIVNEEYDNRLKTSTWNIHKAEFLNAIKDKFPDSEDVNNLPVSVGTSEDEEDFLDCREGFDSSLAEFNKCAEQISMSLKAHTEKTKLNAKRLNNLNKKFNPVQVRTIMQIAAYDNSKLSDVYDEEIPVMKTAFEKAISYRVKMKEMTLSDDKEVQTERDAISGLIEATKGALSSTLGLKTTLEKDKSNLDKTYNNSRKRLIGCLEKMVETLRFCIGKSNELLSYTE